MGWEWHRFRPDLGVGCIVGTAALYLAVAQLLAPGPTSHHPRLWPTWWMLVPLGLFVIAVLVTVLPIIPRRRPPRTTAPLQQPPPGPRPGPIAVRMRGGKGTFVRPKFRNQEIGFDTEDTDLNVEEPDIE